MNHMKIKVLKVDIQNHTVFFSSEFGIGKGTWQNDMPSTGNIYYVEIEIKDVLRWGDDILLSEASVSEMGAENDGTYFRGILESVDDDGYAVLRLNENIICIMTAGVPFAVNQFVKVTGKGIDLFPYDT